MILNRWANLPLRSKGLILVACPAAGTVLLACAAFWIGSRATHAERGVNHTLEVREQIEKLRGAAMESTVDARGYLIARDEVYAARLRASLASFDIIRQKLVTLTADNPSQQQRLSQISDLERLRQERIYSNMARFRAGILSGEALAQVLRDSDVNHNSMESLIAGMEGREARLLLDGKQQATWLRAAQQIFSWIGLTLGFGGGILISILFATGITKRIEKLNKYVARLGTGGILDPLPPGEDEIGALGAGVTKTAQILQQRTAALENALHGIAQVDGRGRYVSFNKAYAELTGLVEGASAAEVFAGFRPEFQPGMEAALEQMRSTGRGEAEARVVRADQPESDVAMVFLPVGEAKHGYYIFMHDITRTKAAEAALIHTKDAAVASKHARTKFLAKISHDIRTPLNAILGTADLLSQSPLNPDQSEYVDMFQRNSRRLVALMNDFLDFSKIEAGALRVERVPFRVRPTVEDAVKTFHESASRKGLTLDVELAAGLPEWQMGDPLRIQQILVNLLSNALKFTSEGGVHVKVLVHGETGSRRLRFEVTDTGPGVRPEDRDKIFAPFEQLPDQNPNAGHGAGLGLSICKELAQMLDGELGLISESGKGSTFYFNLPLIETQPSPVAAPRSTPAPAARTLNSDRPVRILVAEDTEDNRILLKHYLKGEPVELQFAADGLEAVEAVRQGAEFDLVLMDIDMPRMDGREATKQIRSMQAARKERLTPIVALSAHAIHEEVSASLAAGCIAHISKPVDRNTLVEAIQRYARGDTRRGKPVIERSDISKEVAALVPTYLAAKTTQIEAARADLSAREYDSIRRFGHNLKGTGRGYGFPEIEALGRELEESAKVADETSIARQLQALHEFVVDAALILAES